MMELVGGTGPLEERGSGRRVCMLIGKGPGEEKRVTKFEGGSRWPK